jgi:hypothetical protein
MRAPDRQVPPSEVEVEAEVEVEVDPEIFYKSGNSNKPDTIGASKTT